MDSRHLRPIIAALLGTALLPAPTSLAAGPVAPAVAAAAAERGAVVSNVAELLRQGYTAQRTGTELAEGLLAQSAALAQVREPAAFVRAMTQAMQMLSPDLHLYLTYEPDRLFAPGAPDGTARAADAVGKARTVVRSGRIDGRGQPALARSNFGYGSAERLAGNIGYLQLSRFVPLALSRPTADAAIGFIANSDAVLIDLRGNIGGAPDAVAFLLSHFFGPDADPKLIHSATNRSQARNDQVLTDPAEGNEKLAKVPLYVLIDGQSASASEMFAYAVQRLGRGTLVGATSAGAGNGGRKYSVGQGFALFLPEWRSTNGPGWEGTGVRPDIAVATTDDSRLVAHRLALQRLATSPGQDEQLKAERERALATIGLKLATDESQR